MTGVVYLLECNKCPMKYIGQTKRKLKIRVKEHNNLLDKKSVVAAHIVEHKKEDHKMDCERIKILDHELNVHRREISEMMNSSCAAAGHSIYVYQGAHDDGGRYSSGWRVPSPKYLQVANARARTNLYVKKNHLTCHNQIMMIMNFSIRRSILKIYNT
ncbi:unnamed protein product [Trichogramma brassicae]|uniref:GIY-YIG domain-containing protein n=1 Tax=Trichogramma brassicae TaxID=86971 RepID=A0A6H5IZS8_9HYME|nr:unnamed protein product [Trichogramma brassicae]